MLDKPKKIAIGSDHAGYRMKEFLKGKLAGWGYMVTDYGTMSEESCDYPDPVHPLAKAVGDGTFPKGIILCGTGNGVSMVANKYDQVRAALCWCEDIVLFARQHNDANILALPARFITEEQAETFARLFLTTAFEGGRHQRRVEKIPISH